MWDPYGNIPELAEASSARENPSNDQPMRTQSKSIAVGMFLLASVAISHAQIVVGNSAAEALPDQGGVPPYDFENVAYTVQFDATGADKIVLTLSSEGAPPSPVITYDGNALTRIPNTANSRNAGIWYLDLAGTGYAGGDADLTFDLTVSTNVNGIGYGVVAISGSAPGFAAANVNTDNATGTSVSLDTPLADSFVVTNYGANGAAPVTVPPGHTLLYTGNVGSARGGASHLNGVAAGANTLTWGGASSAGDTPRTSAAAFVPASAAPVIVSTVPADDETDAIAGDNLVASFSEPVVAGTGFVTLRLTSDDSTVESFDVTTDVTFNGQDLTIDPTSDLESDVEYYVLIDADAVIDTSGGDGFAGISDTTSWTFRTVESANPTIATLLPDHLSVGASASADLVVTFDETIAPGTGFVTIKNGSDDSDFETFDVTSSSQLDFTGGALTINPTSNLANASGYYVTIDATAVEDASGNPFAGIADDSVWSFTTEDFTVVNTGDFLQVNPGVTETRPFDAGADATFLIVAISSEKSGEASYGVSYGSNDLELAIAGGAGSGADIWYLDLSATSYAGGDADLVVDQTGILTRNGLGVGMVSITAGAQPIELHATAKSLAGSHDEVTLTTTAASSFVVASFNSNNTSGVPAPSVDSPLNQIYASSNIGSARGAAGYQSSVAAGSNTYSWTVPDGARSSVAAAFVIQSGAGNTFANWISGFSGIEVGVNDGVDDDADGDGNDNGVENYFGTPPDEFSKGLVSGEVDTGAGTFTFSHPLSDSPATDLTAIYRWSKDLATFTDGGVAFGETTVSFSQGVPSNGMVDVTATITGTPLDKLFVDVKVTP